jgi:hypothetical protein
MQGEPPAHGRDQKIGAQRKYRWARFVPVVRVVKALVGLIEVRIPEGWSLQK